MVELDGWTALPAFVPPKERRGLVLIDPPFEQPDEFQRLADGFAAAYAKWPTGIFMLWYPVKSRRATDTLARQVATVCGASGGEAKCLRLEFSVAPIAEDRGLTSAGLLIVNPPWTLAAELRTILPELQKPLGQGGAGRFRLEAVKARTDLRSRQLAGNRTMLPLLGLALRSASANGGGGLTRPRIFLADCNCGVRQWPSFRR